MRDALFVVREGASMCFDLPLRLRRIANPGFSGGGFLGRKSQVASRISYFAPHMKILLLAIGKPKSKPIQALVEDYSARLSHYLPFEIVSCRDDAQAMSKIDPQDLLVVLDERGREKSSEELAAFISEQQSRGTKKLVFFIGGPDGVGSDMRARAKLVMGLSRMTFPHELVQVIITEQLYRACSINRNEPYHRS